MMTLTQMIRGMQERQRRILKLRSEGRDRLLSEEKKTKAVRGKGPRPRSDNAYERYQRHRLGLRPASEGKVIMKNGKPTA